MERIWILSCCIVLVFPLFVALAHPSKIGFYVEVPYVHQVENYCGPATLAMVFRYWDRSADHHELASYFEPFPEKGLSGVQLKELARKNGFSAYSFLGHPEKIREHLRKGWPVIVALDLKRSNHFVLVVGWDASRREWLVHDPAVGPYQRRSEDQFAKQWAKLDNWSLLVLPETLK